MTNPFHLSDMLDAFREIPPDANAESLYILNEREYEENGLSADRENRA